MEDLQAVIKENDRLRERIEALEGIILGMKTAKEKTEAEGKEAVNYRDLAKILKRIWKNTN